MTGMPPQRPLVVIGFDAFDPGIAQHLAAEGRLPNIGRLLSEGAWSPVSNPPGLVVGSTWPSFWTGLWPSRHGFYCFRQLEPHSYKVRRFTPRDIAAPAFWTKMAEAGKRVCILDVPLVPLTQPQRGVHVIDWGTHDRMLDFTTSPPELQQEIDTTEGKYPIEDRCDHYAARGDWEELRKDLLIGIEKKTALTIRMLERGPWDAFVAIFAESHCAGHQFWWAHDKLHPRYTPDAGDPLLQVYEALDAALGRLLPHVPANANLVLLLSHGIGSHYDADHLLEPLLARLDHAYGPPSPFVYWREKFLRLFLRWGKRLRGEDQSRLAPDAKWVDASRRFIRIPNNELFGGVRLNIAGREPRGRIKPGPELEQLVAWLEREMLALKDPDSGRPIVRRVLRASEHYTGDRLDGLPDLLIDWDRTAPKTAISSERIGVIRGQYAGVRTGDHRPTGLVVARGPGIPSGPIRADIRVVDLAPTFSVMVGLDGLDSDGTPIPTLVPAEVATGS